MQQLEKQQNSNRNGFQFKDRIKIKDFDKLCNNYLNGTPVKKSFGTIVAKVKDQEIYVITLHSAKSVELMKIIFGYPNRHLDLEWGSYTGEPNEFIVPGIKLELRNVP